MQPIHEKYRPVRWADVLGQDKVLQRLACIRKVQGSFGGQAYWIVGKSGQGKSTIARLLARELASEHAILEVDAGQFRHSVAALRDLERESHSYALPDGSGKVGRAYILNEAHALSDAAVKQLLLWTERLASHVVVIFTTTHEGQQLLFDGVDGAPLVARCTRLELTSQGLAKVFAERIMAICEVEGLGSPTVAQATRLVNDCAGSMRMALQEVGAGRFLDSSALTMA